MKKMFIVLGITVGVLVGCVVVLVGFTAFWMGTAKSLPVSSGDKQLVVRAADLVPYFDEYSPDETAESLSKVRYLDQSEELDYEYDSGKEGEPYIAMTVSYERNMNDANTVYVTEWSGIRLGLNFADGKMELEENNSFYSAGDRSRFANILYDGDLVGHLLVAQKGNSVYAFIISGFVIDDPDVWRALFDDRISKLKENESD